MAPEKPVGRSLETPILEPPRDAVLIGVGGPDDVEEVDEAPFGRFGFEVVHDEGAHAATACGRIDDQENLGITPGVVQSAVAECRAVFLDTPPFRRNQVTVVVFGELEDPGRRATDDSGLVAVPVGRNLANPFESHGCAPY